MKNLGIAFDEELTWTRQLNLAIAKAYGNLKNALRFKYFLSEPSEQKLIETYVLSPFNYGNVLMQNVSEQLQNKIQKLQNRCIRSAFNLSKYDRLSGF